MQEIVATLENIPRRRESIRRKPINSLTGLRIFAALAVLAYHFSLGNHGIPFFIQRPVSIGFLGVNLFFALSGFILVYNYYGRNGTLMEFYWHRFIRIYPTYIAALALSILVMPRDYLASMSFSPLTQFTLEALLVQAWIPGGACGINCPDWSLSVEAFFYVIFPMLLLLLERYSIRILVFLSFSLWLLSAIAGVYATYIKTHQADSNVSMLFEFICYHPVLNLNQFFMGAVAGVLFIRRPDFFKANKRPIQLLLGGLIIGTVAWTELLLPAPVALLRLGLLSPMFVILILYVAQNDSIWASLLAAAPVVLLGEASYAVYLYQTPVNRAVLASFQALAPDGNTLLAGILSLCCLLALSILSFCFFEKPARSWLRLWWTRT